MPNVTQGREYDSDFNEGSLLTLISPLSVILTMYKTKAFIYVLVYVTHKEYRLNAIHSSIHATFQADGQENSYC